MINAKDMTKEQLIEMYNLANSRLSQEITNNNYLQVQLRELQNKISSNLNSDKVNTPSTTNKVK